MPSPPEIYKLLGRPVFSQDASILVIARQSPSEHVTIEAWKTSTGRRLRVFEDVRSSHIDLAISPDNDMIAALDGSGTVRFFSITSQFKSRHSQIIQMPVHLGFISSDRLIAGGSRRVYSVKVSSGETTVLTLAEGITDMDVSGGRVAYVDGKGLNFYDNEVKSFQFGSRTCRLSPDGKHIAYTSGPSVMLMRVTDGIILFSALLTSDMSPSILSWSANSEMFVTGGLDRMLRIWHLNGQQDLFVNYSNHSHNAVVTNARVTPDGNRIYSVGDDAVRIWDMGLRRQIRDFRLPR